MRTAIQLLDQIQRDNQWLKDNFKWIQKDYEKQFIAIKDGKIIANAKTMNQIISILKRKRENPAQTFITFIREKNLLEIF